MGTHTKPPYKKKDRVTGQWIVVTPEPEEYNIKGQRLNLSLKTKRA